MATSKLALLETRIAALESQVEHLQTQQTNHTEPSKEDWLDKMYGLFADYPDFEKVVELGRQYRESLRPKPRKRASKKKGKSAK